jgi:DNA (cytosine-5)-methyltransferase 1
MKPAPSVCHGPPTSRCQSKRTVAPCRATIRDCTARHPGDSWSASLRFIQCKKCRQLGKWGRFELVPSTMTIGSLFSGIGGLELGLQMAGCGPVLWQCDADPFARAVLAQHQPGVRIYEDVRDINAAAQPVELVCGGFPCQPHSLAGRRKGTADARWLWPEFKRVIGAVRPSLVFIENVPGLRTTGLRDVLVDLSRLGFDAEWDCFSAAEVGAPHIRRRLFVLAYSDRLALGLQHGRSRGASGAGEAVARLDGLDRNVANPVRAGRRSEKGRSIGDGRGEAVRAGEALPRRRGRAVAHPDGQGELQQGRAFGAKRGRSGDDGRENNPWAAEPDVGRVAHGVPARAHRLRLLGNAVVPAQAAHAFQVLAARAAEGR